MLLPKPVTLTVALPVDFTCGPLRILTPGWVLPVPPPVPSSLMFPLTDWTMPLLRRMPSLLLPVAVVEPCPLISIVPVPVEKTRPAD